MFLSCRNKEAKTQQDAKKASLSGASGKGGGASGSGPSAATKAVRHLPAQASSLFFAHNTALGPPYRVIVDTNFINFSLQNKIELVQGMMDCLYAESESVT